MNRIERALLLVEEEIEQKKASCALYSDTGSDETTLGGTKDGYLNLIKALLILIKEFEKSKKSILWDDLLKENMLQIPDSTGNGVWITGTEIFSKHEEFISTLKEVYENTPDIYKSIVSDPDFKSPVVNNSK